MAVAPSCITIDLEADATLNDFTIQTLKERYLVGDEKSPQEAFARASAAFADDPEHAQRLYDYVRKGWFMYATPLLSNGGTTRGLPISCFLTTVEDSRESISAHYDEMIWLSSMGGGIGSYWGELRSVNEETSKGSRSTGQMPFIAVDDRLILAVSQGGTRRGSEAVYSDIHHPEIEEFMTGRKSSGGDRNRKFENLHNAVNITDEFMYAVRDGKPFNLVSPKDGRALKTVPARDLWRLLMETRMQTGEPYIHFIDTSNRAMPEAQKKRGLKVRQSNLCVTGDTEILLRGGFVPIESVVGKTVEAWNGEEWSTVTPERTADEAELVRVWFEDGGWLDCTPYHKFYDQKGREVRAGALKPGTRLEQGFRNLPVIDNEEASDLKTRASAYVAGWATFAGFEDANRLAVHCPSMAPDAALKRLMIPAVDAEGDVLDGGMVIRYEPSSIDAGRAPLRWGISRTTNWLAGAFDAAGEWLTLDNGEQWLSLGSTDAEMIRMARLTALQCGLSPRVRFTDTFNVLMLCTSDVAQIAATGAMLRNLEPVTDALGMLTCGATPADVLFTTVAEVHPLPWKAPTFCAAEPGRARLTFNGYITGNCTEIMLATGRDEFDKKRTAVCCLSSVNAEAFDEWRDHPTFIEDLMRMLDNTLQVFIDEAPDVLENARYSAMRERAVGLGLFGFRSYLQSHDVVMESEEARAINMRLFRHLREQADAASLKLGAERGEAPDMEGTGERFSHKLALAPNASSSIICPTRHGSGASAATEPDRANAFLHKTLSGSFPVHNPYLKAKLAAMGKDTDDVWKSIVANEGSVQHLDFLSAHDKAVFRTAIEIDQLAIVRLAADRSDLICQGQSVNIFLPHDADAGLISMIHYHAWEWGLKSLYYLRSTTPKRAENTNDKIERKATAEGVEPTAGISANPLDDTSCIACEG